MYQVHDDGVQGSVVTHTNFTLGLSPVNTRELPLHAFAISSTLEVSVALRSSAFTSCPPV